MRILSFNMQGYAATQFVEDNEEAERLYAEAAKALAGYEMFPFSAERSRPTHEMVVSDGTRQTFRLASLLSITLIVPGVPDWLRDFHVATKRMERLVEREAQGP